MKLSAAPDPATIEFSHSTGTTCSSSTNTPLPMPTASAEKAPPMRRPTRLRFGSSTNRLRATRLSLRPGWSSAPGSRSSLPNRARYSSSTIAENNPGRKSMVSVITQGSASPRLARIPRRATLASSRPTITPIRRSPPLIMPPRKPSNSAPITAIIRIKSSITLIGPPLTTGSLPVYTQQGSICCV